MPRRLKIKVFRPLLVYVRPYRVRVFGAIVAILVSAMATLGLGQGLKALIDEGFAKGRPDLLNDALLIMAAIAVVMSCASFSRTYLIAWLGERVVADVRRNVFSHLMRMPVVFYEKERVGDLLSRLSTDTTLVQSVVGGAIPIAARNILILLGGFFFLLFTSTKLTLLVLATVPLILVMVIILGRRVRRLSKLSQDRLADMAGVLEETLNAIKTVFSFNREMFEISKFTQATESAFVTARRRIRSRSFLSSCVIFLVFSSITVMLWVGSRDVFRGALSGGELAAFVFYALITAGSVAALSDVAGEIQRASGALERLFALLEQPAVADAAPPFTGTLRGDVRFDTVTFSYPSRPTERALKDFSLTIRAGEKIAIVGPSGSGKTTLFQLLLRFYEPTSGTIFLDHLPLSQLPRAQLREHFAVVPQDPVIFSDTLYANIAYGRPDAPRADILAAAAAAQVDDFIPQLPQGYDTHLGQKGVRLSGGQKQRIAIARAVLKNPKILLLDEATSALDVENESKIKLALQRLTQGRTTLIITHRLSSVQDADRIVVLQNGQIEAVGTHTTLFESSALYRRLISSPAAA